MSFLNIQSSAPEIYGQAFQSGKNIFADRGPTEHYYSGNYLTDLTSVNLINKNNNLEVVDLLALNTGDYGTSTAGISYSSRSLMFTVPKNVTGTYHLQAVNQYGSSTLQDALTTLQKPKVFFFKIEAPTEPTSSSSSSSSSSSQEVSTYEAIQAVFSNIASQTDFDGTCAPFSYGFHYLPNLSSLNNTRAISSTVSDNYAAGHFQFWDPCLSTNVDDSYRDVRVEVTQNEEASWTVSVVDMTYYHQVIYFYGTATQVDFSSNQVVLNINSELSAGNYSFNSLPVYTVGGSCQLTLNKV